MVQMDGNRVIVTAAASGIGLAIAQRLLAVGARVHVCDVDDAALAALPDIPELSYSRCDVGRSADVEQMVAHAVDKLGGIDTLVNNAGVGGPRSPLEMVSDADWAATMQVNVTGAFYCIRAAVPLMKAQRSGSIVNISTASARTGLPNRTPYVVSKAALEGLTHNASRELGPFNIRVNSIAPGIVDNPRATRLIEAHARESGRLFEDVEAEVLGFVSMRSRVSMDDVGDAVAFLASPMSRHVSNQTISVCGNMEWET